MHPKLSGWIRRFMFRQGDDQRETNQVPLLRIEAGQTLRLALPVFFFRRFVQGFDPEDFQFAAIVDCDVAEGERSTSFVLPFTREPQLEGIN